MYFPAFPTATVGFAIAFSASWEITCAALVNAPFLSTQEVLEAAPSGKAQDPGTACSLAVQTSFRAIHAFPDPVQDESNS